MSNTRKIIPPLPHDLRKSHLSQSRPVHIASGDIEGPSINSHFDAASEAPSEIHSVVVVNDIGEMNVSRESFNEKELLNDDNNFQTLSISFYERKGHNIPLNKSLAAKNSLLAAIISPRNIYPAKKVEKPKEVLKEKTENNIHVPYFAKPLSSKASVNQSVLDKSSSLFSIIERNQSPSTKMLISSARPHYEEGAKVLKPPTSHRVVVKNENKKEVSLIKEAEDYLVNRLEKKVKAQAQQNAQNKENKVLKFKGGDQKNLRLDLTAERVEPVQSEKASLNSERTVFNPERQEIAVKKVGVENDRARLKTERSPEREKPMSKLRESSSKNNRSVINHANKIQSPRGNVTCLNAKVPKLFAQDKSVSKIKRDNDTTQNTTNTQSQILSQNQSQNMNTSATEGVPRRFIELTKNIFTEISEQVSTRKEDFNKNSSAVKREASRERSETRLRSSSKKATKKSMLNNLINPAKIITGSQKASPAKAKMQIVNRLPLHKLLNVAKSGDLRCVTSFRDSSCDNTQDQTFKTEKDELSSIMGGLPKTTTNKASQGLRESLNGAKTTRNYQDDLTYGLGGFMSSRAVLGMNQQNNNREKSLNKNVDTSFEFGFRPNTERGVLGKVNENRMSFDRRRGSKPNGVSLLKDHSQDESKIVNRSSRILTATGTEKKAQVQVQVQVQKNHQHNKENNNHKFSFEHKHHEKQNLNTSHGNGSVPGTCCKCGNPTKKKEQVQNAYYK